MTDITDLNDEPDRRWRYAIQMGKAVPAALASPYDALHALANVRLAGRVVIVRRMYSAPEHITMFSAGAVAVGAAYPAIMAHTGDRGIPCPLRALTGVPCPFCGLTTATVALAHGQWTAAAMASPLVCLVAMMAVGTVPVLAARFAGLASPPRPVSDRNRRRIGVAVGVVVALNWLFELHRFGFI